MTIRLWLILACVGCGDRAHVAAPAKQAVVAPTPAAPPPPKQKCFPGAYYRKLVSTVDSWTRIEATATLPSLSFDPARVAHDGKLLDNASVYLGGRSDGGEIDCGLSWEVVLEADGSVSRERKAFRPFWRGKQWHTAPARADLYFHPGDVVRMTVETKQVDKLTMTIERGVGGAFEPAFSVDFDAPGFGPSRRQEFKVVSAIDQSGNEGKAVTPSATHVDGLLLAATVSGAATTPTWSDMRCPDPKYFDVARMPDGRERVGISAAGF